MWSINGCEHYRFIEKSHNDSINFTDETVAEMLISFVSLRPPLWDHRLAVVQRTKPIKEQLWLEIFREFGANQDLTPAVLQKKWKNLRDKYIQTKAEVEAYIPTGSSAPKRKKIWKHYEAMCFLSDSVSPRATTSSYTTSASLLSPESDNNDEVHAISEPSTSRNRGNRKQKDGTSEAILKAINTVCAASTPEKSISPICHRISELLAVMPGRERTELEIKLLSEAYEGSRKYL